MDSPTPETTKEESFAFESNLALQSPPPMLVQSPCLSKQPQELEPQPPLSSMKRTRADIATPKKPGTMEAQRQQEMEYIATPARAPSAMKRMMRSESPDARITDNDGSLRLAAQPPLSSKRNQSPPKFLLGQNDSSRQLKSPIMDDDDGLFGSPQALKSKNVDNEKHVQADTQSEMVIETDDDVIKVDENSNEQTMVVTEDSDIEFTIKAETDTLSSMVIDTESPAIPEYDMLVVKVTPEAIAEAALAPGTMDADVASAAKVEEQEPRTPAAIAKRFPAATDRSERAELTTAKIFDDPELMHAAAVPLPGTPSLNNQSVVTPCRESKDSDFSIPTNWLMDLNTVKRGGQQAQPDSPTQKFEEENNLIPVTPASQKLMDSLEIQWVSPSKVAKYSQEYVDQLKAEYEAKLQNQKELSEKLMREAQTEHEAKMKRKDEETDQMLKEADEMINASAEHQEREYAKKLAEQEQKHQEEIRKRDEELGQEIDTIINERKEIIEERDQLRATLDDYVATSTKLLEEKDAETVGLTRELGKLTLDRQRLQEQLQEALVRADALEEEKTDSLVRIEALTTENMRLDQLTSALRNDVLVAEERCTKIKDHAQNTLAQANAEIQNNHEQLTQAREEAATSKAQAAKAEARLRSVQIQLDSMKRQNQELLALCEGL
ncbi:hypothetical protein LPJ78_005607 [Coemansia sp. RSA 989]|nr:hypothetical protein LPJ79_005613 [Coemansia sp. RSA 1821]KAJ1860953.1 hypothetical protein LPJ78_005607 [Coemansia sp. RSA 989]KAJ2667675.1 hypothetical protein IWW42_005759 [Coemansia sp. RSA 1085]